MLYYNVYDTRIYDTNKLLHEFDINLLFLNNKKIPLYVNHNVGIFIVKNKNIKKTD